MGEDFIETKKLASLKFKKVQFFSNRTQVETSQRKLIYIARFKVFIIFKNCI